MTQVTSAHLGESLGTDFFSVREQFIDEQWSHFITVRRFVDEEVVPVVGPYWERAEICWPLVRRLPELGIVGEDIKGYWRWVWFIAGLGALATAPILMICRGSWRRFTLPEVRLLEGAHVVVSQLPSGISGGRLTPEREPCW